MDAAIARSDVGEPPRFLQLVGHPVRWRLLGELARSDRAVRELTDLLGEGQSLVSYHLTQLGAAGLVRNRHSSADRRDRYYTIDLGRCRELLQETGGSLHPALSLAAAPRPLRSGSAQSRRRRILFLCTGNSARSQMAEALVAQMSGGRVDAVSAGSRPKPLHPNAVRVMKERGIDISGNRTKHLEEYTAQRFDVVITLCDRVREVCPEYPFHPDLVHWSIPDPAVVDPNDPDTYPAFERLATELSTRIEFLLVSLDESLDQEVNQ
jgi:protein-tyrosine-phosphatase/DNA-binding transcriptional ArsR family regulator